MSIQIHPIKAFEDNYIWVLHNNSEAIVVDPGESAQVTRYLSDNQLTLSTVLITHHHYDHINGVEKLIADWGCEVYGPLDDRITFKHHVLEQGDNLAVKSMQIDFEVLATPGHTKSHICFYNNQWLFCGDTLFSIGCGRMFEGTAAEYVESLNKIKSLIPSTEVYCTHEYTLSNLKFALFIEPNNQGLLDYQQKINSMRKQNKASLPTRLETQLQLNPFLRTNDKNIQKIVSRRLNTTINNELTCFAELRKLKDSY
ncbi:hydroxyacylglutathione hydrolase [Marinicella litoralis]|uniref:Hydroxyacylglutathione hydrolase n=1 Tax=Marinicella litoralis TaxID=644220 RepID=A0A4V6PXU8_9GAMM|nr:hydroxyacylglutathione hydrolase [Marinicella litoralis]TDR18521.1 hydroxyacylglutathione hydrolase [Marinicella litoralis]